jgi:hypothetical protein
MSDLANWKNEPTGPRFRLCVMLADDETGKTAYGETYVELAEVKLDLTSKMTECLKIARDYVLGGE